MDRLSILAMAAASVQQSESPQSQSSRDFSIRKARYADIAFLGQVERSAAEIFKSANLDFLIDGPTVDPKALAAMIDAQHLWVACDFMDYPIGFTGGENIEGDFHLAEISVAQDFQGKGVGRALMEMMEADVRREGYKAITLTTFRTLAWNGPWYGRLGFTEVNPIEMGPTYLGILENERQNGFDMSARCVMRKIL
jgi:GNAT superfamily N-acetyltransferase